VSFLLFYFRFFIFLFSRKQITNSKNNVKLLFSHVFVSHFEKNKLAKVRLMLEKIFWWLTKIGPIMWRYGYGFRVCHFTYRHAKNAEWKTNIHGIFSRIHAFFKLKITLQNHTHTIPTKFVCGNVSLCCFDISKHAKIRANSQCIWENNVENNSSFSDFQISPKFSQFIVWQVISKCRNNTKKHAR